ncbi:hypothetical protein L195_g023213 [Trifolium pratense]|uniref:Uncharacterized protein n=1 Tax=Trifolium pratense TaxID=57577 RepID=A0A2K3NA85_TRIPR|nr:hypothetical protein L195_g023213 [Trifolium pratense]
MGSLTNEEEFFWFPSSHSAEGSDDGFLFHSAKGFLLLADAQVAQEASKVISRKAKNVDHYTPPEQYADINQRFGASSSGVTSLDSN